MTHAPNSLLELEVVRQANAAVVRVRGSAGMEDAGKIQSTLKQLTDDKVTPIVLDLGEMDFIGSAALGEIITAQLNARHYEGCIRLVNPQRAVLGMLEATRLTRLFAIFTTTEDALHPREADSE